MVDSDCDPEDIFEIILEVLILGYGSREIKNTLVISLAKSRSKLRA